jgi:hypothetical protein
MYGAINTYIPYVSHCVASLVRARSNSQPAAAETQHFRHKRHSLQATIAIQRGKNLLAAANLYKVTSSETSCSHPLLFPPYGMGHASRETAAQHAQATTPRTVVPGFLSPSDHLLPVQFRVSERNFVSLTKKHSCRLQQISRE